MGLQIISSQNKNEGKNTFIGQNNYFVLELYRNDYYQNNKLYWRPGFEGIFGFHGISTENLSLNFTTEWTDAGGAKLGKAISTMINSKIFKAFAGQSEQGFQPMILTDAWTQQKVQGSQPLKIDLTFKLYNENSTAGTNYTDALKFLTHICSPIKPIKMGSDAVGLFKRAVGGFIETGSEIYEAGTNILKTPVKDSNKADVSFTETAAAYAGGLVNAANGLYKDIANKSILGRNNGNFTTIFSFGDKIFSHNRIDDKGNLIGNIVSGGSKNIITGLVDWIVTSFSCTPSVQFTWDEENKLPKPLWCNFKVSLETRYTLSNKYVYDLLNQNIITLAEEKV